MQDRTERWRRLSSRQSSRGSNYGQRQQSDDYDFDRDDDENYHRGEGGRYNERYGTQGFDSDDRQRGSSSPFYPQAGASPMGFRNRGRGGGSTRGQYSGQRGAYQSTDMDYGQDEYTGGSEGSRYSMPYASDQEDSRFRSEGRGSSHRGKGPKSYNRSDDRLCEDVCERLTEDGDIDASEIDVEVNDGRVNLSGTVEERHQRYLAEDIACSVWGVKDVENQLRVASGEESGRDRSSVRASQGGSAGRSRRAEDSDSQEQKKKDKAA